MISFNNGVANVDQTPGIAANTFANRPTATIVAIGSVYIATDTGNMYRSNGTTWSSIGGGGGETPTIDQVLQQGGLFNNDRYIDIGTFQLDILCVGNPIAFFNQSQINIGIDFGLNINFGIDLYLGNSSTFFKINPNNNKIFTQINGNPIGFDLQPQIFKFGDTGNSFDGIKLVIDSENAFIATQTETQTKGIYFDYISDYYIYGTENYNLKIDNNLLQIQTYMDGTKYGMYFDYNTQIFSFGDYDSNFNSTFIIINDAAGQVAITGQNKLSLQTNELNLNGALTVGGVHTPTGTHLQIKINGVSYTINLQTP